MAWAKPPPDLLAAFDRIVPGGEGVERRKMFGLPCAFLNGNMFAGVHEGSLVLRLSEAEREAAKREIGARAFMPMRRAMREYVAIDWKVGSTDATLKAWVNRACDYAAGLPPKVRERASKRTSKSAQGASRKARD